MTTTEPETTAPEPVLTMLSVTLTGLGYLLTHNERLADKQDAITRELAVISSKRRKTDADLAEMSRLEFFGGVYETADGLVGIPTWNVIRSIHEGAKLRKLGRDLERAILPRGADIVPITHEGPSKPSDAWLARCYDYRSVKVSGRISRTRPRFNHWSVTADLLLDITMMNLDAFRQAAEMAGQYIGIGDYRPRFGRYTAEVVDLGRLDVGGDT